MRGRAWSGSCSEPRAPILDAPRCVSRGKGGTRRKTMPHASPVRQSTLGEDWGKKRICSSVFCSSIFWLYARQGERPTPDGGRQHLLFDRQTHPVPLRNPKRGESIPGQSVGINLSALEHRPAKARSHWQEIRSKHKTLGRHEKRHKKSGPTHADPPERRVITELCAACRRTPTTNPTNPTNLSDPFAPFRPAMQERPAVGGTGRGGGDSSSGTGQ